MVRQVRMGRAYGKEVGAWWGKCAWESRHWEGRERGSA